MNKSIFTRSEKNEANNKVVSLNTIFGAMSKLAHNKASQVKANVFGCESIEPTKMNSEQRASYDTFQELRSTITTALSDELGGAAVVSKLFGNEAITASALALLAANGSKGYREDFATIAPVPDNNSVVYRSPFGNSDTKYGQLAGNERFDEAKYSPYRATTAALQLAILNQQEYIELAYPTLVLGPTEFGYTLKVPRGTIQDRAHIRNNDGSPKDIRKTSIIAQYRQAGSAVDHANRLYPIVSDTTKDYLADYNETNVITFAGTTDKSKPVKLGTSCDYLRITQPTGYTEFLQTSGTASLAPGGKLEELFLKFSDDDVVCLDIGNRPGARFVFDNTNGLEFNTERMNFESTFTFTKDNIKNIDGTTDSPALSKLVSFNETIEIVISLGATILLENGTLTTKIAKPYINKVIDARGFEIDREKWTDDQKAFAKQDVVLDSANFDIRRSNSNLEIFGDIVHVDTVQVHFESAINHPISVLATVNSEDSPEILAMVSQAVKLNKHRMATLSLFDALRHTKELCIGNGLIDPIRVQGVPAGALCYLPSYVEGSLDVSVGMNNEKSGEVLNDITGSIRAKLKEMVSTMMTESMYVQAVQSTYVVGEKQKQVKIAIITSQYIADFLQLTGDPRLLGDEYDVEIQVNPASSFDGKIVFFPTTIDNGKTEVSPLQHGVGLYSPDIVYQAVGTYGSQTVREMRVMHRWTPHTLGVAMGQLDVSGIKKVLEARVGKTVVVQNP